MNSFLSAKVYLAVGLFLWGLCLAGCVGSRAAEDVPPDQRFGHRPEGAEADGRRIVAITPPDGATDYFYYPATFDSVHVRPAPLDASKPADAQTVEVEVLIKGAFPDACMELHAMEQERTGNIINASLEMRRPQGAICASVQRPYRFYVMLGGRYNVGNYTLKLNDEVVPFEVLPPPEQAQ